MELPAPMTRMTSHYIIVNAQPGLLAKIVKVCGYFLFVKHFNWVMSSLTTLRAMRSTYFYVRHTRRSHVLALIKGTRVTCKVRI